MQVEVGKSRLVAAVVVTLTLSVTCSALPAFTESLLLTATNAFNSCGPCIGSYLWLVLKEG